MLFEERLNPGTLGSKVMPIVNSLQVVCIINRNPFRLQIHDIEQGRMCHSCVAQVSICFPHKLKYNYRANKNRFGLIIRPECNLNKRRMKGRNKYQA